MRFLGLACGFAALAFGACSGNDFSSSNASGGSGGVATGGAVGTGNSANTGGAVGTGGATGGSNTGGAATGGATGTGGTTVQYWCDVRTVAFCDDFDHYPTADAALSAWSTFSQINGSFSLTDGLSPANALHVRSSAVSDVNTIIAKTLDPLSTAPTTVRLEFALKVNEVTGMTGLLTGMAFAAIVLGTDIATDGVVALELAPDGNGVVNLHTVWYKPPPDGGNPFASLGSQLVSALPTLNQWGGRIAIEIQYGLAADAARTACVQFLAGNVPQGSCKPLAPGMEVPPTTYTAALGLRSIWGTTGTVDLVYDNVVFTTN